MATYYYTIDLKEPEYEFETASENYEDVAAEIVESEEDNSGEYFKGDFATVYLWDSAKNYLGKYDVVIELQRMYYGYKVKNDE